MPWLLAIPAVMFMLAFHHTASAAGAFYAFTDWDGLSAQPEWTGLDNFRQIFRESGTRGAVGHTLLLAGTFFVMVNFIGLLLALGLNRTVKTRFLLRSLFFAPVVISPLAVGFIWQYIFDYEGGLNRFFEVVGLDEWQTPWLGDPNWALWAILVVLVWQFSGLTMVIYLAGLQGISDELYEAAVIDGSSAWLRFRRVILPLLAPAITVNATLTLIFGMRVFDQVLALTGGGPGFATETLATQVWQQTFQYGRFGFGTALALMLAAMIAALAFAQTLILRRREVRG